MKHSIIYLIVSIFLFTGLTACSEDNDPLISGDGTTEQEIKFSLSLPGMNRPLLSKALTASDENKIADIDILVFDVDDNNNETFSYHRAVTSTITQGGTDNQEVSFKTWLKRGNNQNIVLIANARPVVNTIISSIAEKGSKADILKKLVISRTGSWPSDSSLPIPMYSETGKTDIHAVANTNPPLNMQLLRMLARIDVKNLAANFELQEVYLCNASMSGYISPEWNTKGNIAFGATTPNLPPSFSKQSPLPYTVLSETLEREIYTFESAEATDTNGHDNVNRKNSTCLVLKGLYSGKSYYYRIDFTYPDPAATDPSSIKYMPLLRNYKYEIDITRAEGIGYSSIQDAINSYTVSSNLKTRILWYDEAKAKDISYNGQYMLALTDDSFLFEPGTTDMPIEITTDYPKGWEIDPVNGIKNADGSSASSWLTVNTFSGAANSTPVIIAVADIPQNIAVRAGYIEITSGRLRADIEIIQTQYNIRESSNSYIISPQASAPLLIPVSRAEEAIAGSLERRNNLSAKFVWTDNQNGMNPSGSVQHAAIYGKSRKAVLVVEPGTETGNTLIAAEDNGEIKWSWHIWTTDYIPSGTIMDRNLGSLYNGTNEWWKSRGLFYQWGRKDPFPYAYAKKEISNPSYPGGNEPEKIEAAIPYFYDEHGSLTDVSSSNITNSAATVRQPDKFTSSVLWHGSDGMQSWNRSGNKTIFDPCPDGWRVPANSTWQDIDVTNFITGNTVWNRTQSDVDYDTPYTAGRFANNFNNSFYPAGGGCFYDSGLQQTVINDAAIAGYYWTNTATGNDQSIIFKFTEASPKEEVMLHPNSGFSIRCVKE